MDLICFLIVKDVDLLIPIRDDRFLILIPLTLRWDLFSPWKWVRLQMCEAKLSLTNVAIYFLIYDVLFFLQLYLCLYTAFLLPLCFRGLLVLGLYKDDYNYLQIFKCVSFWLHSSCGKWQGWASAHRFNHTSWKAVHVVTPYAPLCRSAIVVLSFWWCFHFVFALL